MSAESFGLKIYTPVGLVLDDSAAQVTLPSSYNGEIGFLPGHARYSGLLGTGLLEYFSTEEKKAVRLVISGGFCNFDGSELVLLADSVAVAGEVDREVYAASRQELIDQLKTGNTADPDWIYARTELDRIEAIDRLISH